MTKYEYDSVHEFGRNPSINIASDEDVWDGGGDYDFPTVAQIHDIKSDDPADALAGTGARTMSILGLDENYERITEIIILDGTTIVPTEKSYLRINRMTILTGGSGGKNAGTITATGQIDATITSQINPGINNTHSAIFTVENGADFQMSKYYLIVVNTVSSVVGSITLNVRKPGGVFVQEHLIATHSLGATKVEHDFVIPFKIDSKSDVLIRGSVSVNATEICAGYDGKFSR